MIGINCLFRNTSLIKDLHNMVEYMGYDRVANGKDPSVTGIYRDLRKAGVEVDLRSVGEIYKNALSHVDDRFTQRSEVDKITGRDMEYTLRNLMLRAPKEGEQQIGRMSPEEYITSGLMKTFYNDVVEDTRTKSVMRELQDAAYKQAQRMVGDLPSENESPTPEHWQETVNRALELDNKGYKTLNGTMNNAHTLFEGMKAELSKRSAEIGMSHDHELVDQWHDYVNSLENATYSLLLSKDQAKNVLHGAMKDAGYVKDLKDGRSVLDWNKLAGNINDIGVMRDTVRKVMETHGYDAVTSSRIADALQQEYVEMRGKMEVDAKANYDRLQNTWDGMSRTEKKEFDVNSLINKRLNDWENFKKLTGDNGVPLNMTKFEAQRIIAEGLKAEGLGKKVSGGKLIIDWTKLAGRVNSDPSVVSQIAGIDKNVRSMLEGKGYTPEQIEAISQSVSRKYMEVRQSIIEHATNKLNSMQRAADNPISASEKSDIQRLAELHDMGAFNGAHDDLLNHVIGLDAPTSRDMAALANIGKVAADLSRELNGKNYLAAPVFQDLQRQINTIIGRNITNKTALLKIVGSVSHFFQLENMGIIGNAFNLLENNLSGAKEMMSANFNLINKVGVQNAFKDGKLLKATWQNIAAGGPEYGDEPGKFGHHDFISDRFSIKDINKQSFGDPKQYGKILGSIIVAPAKAFLNGSDGAFKSVIHKKTMVLALHKALTEHGMESHEAAAFLNNALYGKSLDDARQQASAMLDKYGQRNTKQMVERLANNLVIQNLNADGHLSDDVIDAAYQSSYHTASLGMGHAANNPFSRMLLASKAKAINEENQLIKDQKWGQLAYQRLMNTVWHNGVLRFMGGGANWGVLRLQSGFGIGLATGYLGKFRGADELNFDSKEKIQDSMQRYLNSQREIQRAVVGLSFLATNVGLIYAYGATRKKEEGEDPNEGGFQSAYNGIAKNYVSKRLLTKVGADAILFDFLANTSKSPAHGYLDAAFKYTQNNFNIGNTFSPGGEIMQAASDVTRGEKGYRKALGDIGQIAGNMVEVPFYRSYKQVGKLIDYGFTGADPKPKYMAPFSVFEGLLGGGMLEDLGLYHRNSPITALPGLGDKEAQAAANDGIRNIDDLKKHPGWLQQNLSGKKLEKAEKAYEEVYGGDKGTSEGGGGDQGGGGASGTYRQEEYH